MYVYHPSLDELPDEVVVWRYLSFTKLVSLLDEKALFFSTIANLGDPFEGSYPQGNVSLRSAFMAAKPSAERSRISKEVEEFTKGSRRAIIVNCWHRSDHESAAMWKLYSGEEEGIAIKTDISALKRSFVGPKEVFLAEVQYIDYKKDVVDENNGFSRYLTKRKSFEHEAEVRALGVNILLKDGEIDRSPEAREQPGVYREVDVGVLVKEVVVAPYAEAWFVDLVKAVAARYDLAAPIRRSSLADTPTWGW